MIRTLFTIVLVDAGVVFRNIRALAGDFVGVHRMNICRSRAHAHCHGKHDAEPKSGRTYERGKFHYFTIYPVSMSKALNNSIYSVRPVVMARIFGHFGFQSQTKHTPYSDCRGKPFFQITENQSRAPSFGAAAAPSWESRHCS